MNKEIKYLIAVGSGGSNIVNSLVDDNLGHHILFDNNIDLSVIPENCHNIYLICTLGGTFGSSEIINIVEALDLNQIQKVIVTTPLSFEGKKRSDLASLTIKKLEALNISLAIIDNNEILENTDANISMKDSFDIVNKRIKGLIEDA